MNQPPRGLIKNPDVLNDALSQDKTKKLAVKVSETNKTPRGLMKILDILGAATLPDKNKKLAAKENEEANKNSIEKPADK